MAVSVKEGKLRLKRMTSGMLNEPFRVFPYLAVLPIKAYVGKSKKRPPVGIEPGISNVVLRCILTELTWYVLTEESLTSLLTVSFVHQLTSD